MIFVGTRSSIDRPSASFFVVLGIAYLDASLFAVYNTDRWKQSPIGIFISDIFSIIQA